MTAFNLTVSANTQNFNLNTALVAAGWNGTDVVEATITVNAGIYVWSDSTSSAGMSITTLPANSTVSLINNGFIIGKGGLGGSANEVNITSGNFGQAGGPAISLANNITITNNSYIAGGGGGGSAAIYGGGGGGAGGGNGGSGMRRGTIAAGGAGGAIGQIGSNGIQAAIPGYGDNVGGGAGGGRVLPGTSGQGAFAFGDGKFANGKGGGAGGGSGSLDEGQVYAYGFPGGARNSQAVPAWADAFDRQSSGGGGWGAKGGDVYNGGNNASVAAAGGAGGKSIALNGFTVRFITTGIIYGEFS
jgi:hypothetical protein